MPGGVTCRKARRVALADAANCGSTCLLPFRFVGCYFARKLGVVTGGAVQVAVML